MKLNIIKLRKTEESSGKITPKKALKMLDSVIKKNNVLTLNKKKKFNEVKKEKKDPTPKTESKRQILRHKREKTVKKEDKYHTDLGASISIKHLKTCISRAITPKKPTYKLKEFPKLEFSLEEKKVKIKRTHSLQRKINKSRRFKTNNFFDHNTLQDDLKIQKLLKVKVLNKKIGKNFFSEEQ